MSRYARWLEGELPQLVEAGILDAAAAERLRRHYAAAQASVGGWGRVLFPLLGSLLIGLGLVLLVAHNWEQFSRTVRLVLVFAPLLLGQMACVWALSVRADERVWREAAAAFTALAFAAALAMVGQIYHFPGDLDRYLLTCGLLALPLVYLLDASLVALLCGAGFAGWAASYPAHHASALAVVGLYGLLAPHLWRVSRADPEGLRARVLQSGLLPLFFIAVIASLPHAPRLGLWWLAELGAICALLDSAATPAQPLWRRPLALYGALATAIAALIGSYPASWRAWYWTLRPDELPAAWLLLIAGMALLGVLVWRAWAQGRRVAVLQAFPAVLMAIVVAVDSRSLAVPLALLLSGYVLVLGLAMMRQGLKMRAPAMATRGLSLIAVLVLLRFVDTGWSFTARGVAFVVMGALFMAGHVWLRRRMRT